MHFHTLSMVFTCCANMWCVKSLLLVLCLGMGCVQWVLVTAQPIHIRALRIINATHNILYAEFATLDDWYYKNPYFYELYDAAEDPFMLKNLFNESSADTKDELHHLLLKEWQCSGRTCSGTNS